MGLSLPVAQFTVIRWLILVCDGAMLILMAMAGRHGQIVEVRASASCFTQPVMN